MDPKKLLRFLRRFSSARVLVIGDLMLDQFIWGDVGRISPEAPVPVVRVTRESQHLGGAANVVSNIRSLGGNVGACGAIGRDDAGRLIVSELKKIGADAAGVCRGSGVTLRKTRVVARNQQVVRFDHEETGCDETLTRALTRFLQRSWDSFDVVIVSDYGKGVINEKLLQAIAELLAEKPLPLIIDPKKANFSHYRSATLVKPNLSEAADASGIEIVDAKSLAKAGRVLLAKWESEAVLITRGENGITLFRRGAPAVNLATRSRQVYDVTGAGDTVAATCALALASGANLEEAAVLANHAAGIAVTKLGTTSITAAELRRDLRQTEGDRR